MSDYDFTYLALGAGVQSSALFVMSALGMYGCPKADVAIFGDTQAEPAWVYEHLEYLKAFGEHHGLPVKIVTAGSLEQHTIDRHTGKRKRVANIPAWVEDDTGRPSPLRRHCTQEYKIDPMERHVRELLGYKPRQRIKHRVRYMLGISTDEAQRMKPSRTPWTEAAWPLIDAGMDRQACLELHYELDLKMPRKSSCVWCPFHSWDFWKDLHDNYPDEWDRCVKFDEQIRDMSASGMRRPVYLSKLLKPLKDHDFTREQLGLFGDGLGNECEGVCGV